MLNLLGPAFLLCALALPASADMWPAESFSASANTTVAGMESDLSGAFWSPSDASLWVVRQNRQVWKMQASGGTLVVVGHWTSLPTGGDLEAITRVDPADTSTFCVLHEDNGTVNRIDVSGGSASLVRSWRLTLGGHMPSESGGAGPEGMTFVPDAWLGGFVDGSGQPRTSLHGMGGLLFVGHQIDGHVYVFDLDPDNDDVFDFVGEYATSRSEVAALEFDGANGLLYIFHGDGLNETEITDLTSSITGSDRTFTSVRTYGQPPSAGGNTNMEGIALSYSDECDLNLDRNFFLTVDGGNSESLRWFTQFPCDCNANGLPDAVDMAAGSAADCNGSSLLDSCEAIGDGDYDADGIVDINDYASLAACLAGPDLPPNPATPECASACLRAFDLDGDDDIDLRDIARFLRTFAGP